MQKQCDTQRGVSLLMALLLVTVVTAVVANVTLSSDTHLKRVQVLTHLEQAMQYNNSLLSYAERVLMLDSYRGNADHNQEDWAQRLPAYPIDGGEISGHINEYSSRFNLSQLRVADPFATAVFYRLCGLLDVSRGQSDAIIEQIRQAQSQSVIGALTEAGFPESDVHELAQYFSLLPINSEKININFVSPEVFAAFFDLTVNEAEQILTERLSNPIEGHEAMMAFARRHQLSQKNANITSSNGLSVIELKFDTKSRYFQVVGEVRLGNVTQAVVALYDRTSNDRIKRLSRRYSKLLYE